MCITVPVKVLSIKDNMATVDMGDGRTTLVDISIVDAKVGDYLVTNTNFAIRIVDEEEALETLKLWEIFKQKEEGALPQKG